MENSADLNKWSKVDTQFLRTGVTLAIPIYDRRGVLLLAAGQTVKREFLVRLQTNGIETVNVHSDEVDRVLDYQPAGSAKTAPPSRGGIECDDFNAYTNELDFQVVDGQLQIPQQHAPLIDQVKQPGSVPFDRDAEQRLAQVSRMSVMSLEREMHSMTRGAALNVRALAKIADDSIQSLTEDLDLFACFGINPHSGKYPAWHSVHVCMLALAIGAQLQLDAQTLRDLAVGCLIHDAGMLCIDHLYESPRRLSPSDFLEITKHPIKVFDLIGKVESISWPSALVAYQIHERCDGSGYPRLRLGNELHSLAKIAAVADVFVGLTSPRPHRAAMMPYFAMETLLQDVSRGAFSAAVVRALLSVVSLFPIGSFVTTSDGRVGRVIRSNGSKFDRPTVELWKTGELYDAPELVNLSEQETLSIVKPLATLKCNS